MIDVKDFLGRRAGQQVYFDTNVFIYLLGNNARYAPLCLELLTACAARHIIGLSGDVTLAELLVKPLLCNDAAAVAAVRELLIVDGAITLVSHRRRCFERAAELRAAHGLKMVDALQLATAIDTGATCLVSNDRQFPRITAIECVSLDSP